MRRFLAVLSLLLPLAVHADRGPYLEPSSGPATGGTEVFIPGQYADPLIVYFGERQARVLRRVEGGIVAITPAHAPGVVRVRLFRDGVYRVTTLSYRYEGPPSTMTRLLLPVLTPPVRGAFGSEFRTVLDGTVNSPASDVRIYGVRADGEPIELRYLSSDRVGELRTQPVAYSGTPGRFIEVPTRELPQFDANLRVYDTSREAETFGTEIPIVPLEEFRQSALALTGVPLDPRYRKTLRLYANAPTTVLVSFYYGPVHPQRPWFYEEITLTGGTDPFQPAYAQFENFPAWMGTTVVRITDRGGLPVWGFITVTNNLTQQITTITPRH